MSEETRVCEDQGTSSDVHVNPHTSKETWIVNKSKCIKVGIKRISLILGDSLQMGGVLDTIEIVLFGQVQGRSYNTTHFRQWIIEIWGQVLE